MCLLIVGATQLSAQQDPQFTQYMLNTLYYNPGFSGVEKATGIDVKGAVINYAISKISKSKSAKK